MATSCWTVGRSRSLSVEPVGQVASSPERQAPGLAASPVTSTVLSAERQYLFSCACVVVVVVTVVFGAIPEGNGLTEHI